MPPPPSPASSTCSEQSGPILVSPGSATASKCMLRIGYVYEGSNPLFPKIIIIKCWPSNSGDAKSAKI